MQNETNGEAEILAEWFRKLQELMPDIPIKHTPRNNRLRLEIIKRFIGQLLTDDERGEYLGLPKGCRIREGAKLISPENLLIGENCWIGENAVLDASGGLEIGSNTSIGLSVFIWTHSSHLTNLCMQNEPGSRLIQRKKTKIGSGCFISGPAVILPGVTIGDFVFVRPFSVVDKDVPNRSIVNSWGVKEGAFSEAIVARMLKSQIDGNKTVS